MSSLPSSLPHGVLAAVVTPLSATLQPNHAVLLDHCRHLLGDGCDGLVLLATAGEANSLSLTQRLALLAAAQGGGLPMERIIVGGGSCALDEAVAMSRAIVQAGAAGVLHHRPQASGAPITSRLIHRLRREFAPVIAGVQNGGGDWTTTAALIAEFPDLAIFSGTERFLLETLRAGGQGSISATLNLTAPLAQMVTSDWKSTAAVARQQELTAIRAVFDGFPTPLAQKEMLARWSGDTAWRNVLPPLLPFSTADGDRLAAALDHLPAFRALRAA